MTEWTLKNNDFVVLRIPYLPENTVDAINEVRTDSVSYDIKASLKSLIAITTQHNVLQAIEFASPTLAENLLNLDTSLSVENLKLASSAYKYIARMSTRSTPFGAFSSVMTLPLGDEEKMCIAPEMRLFIRLDNSCILALANHAKELSVKSRNEYLQVRRNTTVFNIGDEIRYIEQIFSKGSYDFTLGSVSYSEEISKTIGLAEDWISVNNLMLLIKQMFPNAKKSVLKDFIFDLIDVQLLETNLTIVVSSNNSFEALIQRAIHSKIKPSLIVDMKKILNLLNSSTLMSEEKFKENLIAVKEILKTFIPSYRLKKWIHVDSFRDAGEQTYSNEKIDPVIKTIQNIAEFLWKPNSAIDQFTEKFIKKYGDSEVPLLEALDVDSGITFGNKRLGSSPLLDGVIPQPTNSSINSVNWAGLDRYLMSKILDTIASNASVTQIYSDRIEKFKPYQAKPKNRYSGSVSIHGLMLEENNKPLFELRNVNGPSALMMLGRFCCGDSFLRVHCENIANQEQIDDFEVIYAEIIHVPQTNIANISSRPHLRNYEIIYGLGDTNLINCKQIKCKDLYLKVVDRRICLYSKILNKEIKPRLASAHNTMGMNLPVYQFLHSLQSIDGYFSGLHLNAVYFGLPFLPEIRIDDVIISKQRWVITAKEIYQLIQCKSIEDKLILFSKIKKVKKISRYIDLSDYDNNLEFDLQSSFTALIFINEIIKRGKTVIIFKSAKGLTDSEVCNDANVYRNEIIIPCSINNNKEQVGAKIIDSALSKEEVRRYTSFSGERWKYYKIYTGEACADKLISKFIAPIINQLIEQREVKSWYFIRYMDPEYHLRIRLKLVKDYNADSINDILFKELKPLFQIGLINKISEDSYIPEIKRYGGGKIISTCEKLFYYNSVIVTDFIKSTYSLPNKEDLRWRMCLRLAWKLTYDMCESLEEMESFFKKNMSLYDGEFRGDSKTKKKLSMNYRQSVQKISESLSIAPEFLESKYIVDNIYPNYTKSINKFKKLCLEEKENKLKIAQSIIHMDCNRIFILNPRMNEWIIYHYLVRYIRTIIARRFIPGKDVTVGFGLLIEEL